MQGWYMAQGDQPGETSVHVMIIAFLSHLTVLRVVLRIVVTEEEELWQSQIVLTPDNNCAVSALPRYVCLFAVLKINSDCI